MASQFFHFSSVFESPWTSLYPIALYSSAVLKLSSLIVVLVTQSCLTLRDLMDCSLPGSSVYRILQERILEWVAFLSPGDHPDPGIYSGLLHCRQTLYCLSHQGSPLIVGALAYVALNLIHCFLAESPLRLISTVTV